MWLPIRGQSGSILDGNSVACLRAIWLSFRGQSGSLFVDNLVAYIKGHSGSISEGNPAAH